MHESRSPCTILLNSLAQLFGTWCLLRRTYLSRTLVSLEGSLFILIAHDWMFAVSNWFSIPRLFGLLHISRSPFLIPLFDDFVLFVSTLSERFIAVFCKLIVVSRINLIRNGIVLILIRQRCLPLSYRVRFEKLMLGGIINGGNCETHLKLSTLSYVEYGGYNYPLGGKQLSIYIYLESSPSLL